MQTCGKNMLKLLLLSLGLFQVVSTASWYTANDGRRYFIEGSSSYNWLQAMDQCSRRGLQLVVIDNALKNSALVALLRSAFGSSRDLWIGHHDEFNTKKDKNRTWYSASTGGAISFGYWDSGEPNNKYGEHCVEIYRKADFKWNDEDCDTNYFGYICEEHYQTAQCRSEVETKRKSTNLKNSQLSSDFVNTKNNVQKFIEKSRNDTDNLLLLWEKSTEEIVENFKNSLNELILKKPYLQAVVADVGATVNELALEAKGEIAKVTEQTRQSIEDIQLNGEISVNSENVEFAEKIAKHKNEIDTMMAT